MISVKEVTTHTIVIKKSEFVCHLIPCSDIEQAKSLIAQYSDLEATHNCVAYIIGSHERQIVFSFIFIDGFQIGFEIGHKASHHTTRKPRSDKQRVHQTILRTDVKSKKIIHKFLNHAAHFHVGFHIYFT